MRLINGIRVLLAGIAMSGWMAALAASATAQDVPDTQALWGRLAQGGHAALMRHAIAPGTGDPDNFVMEDCNTQRNLSPEGREQARTIGEAFRQHKVGVSAVYSSQWCRALDTARLLDLGEVEPLPALNSFFRQREREAEQTQALEQRLLEMAADETWVLVTHQVNITALTGIFPRSGEIVVVRPDATTGSLIVVGRLMPAD
ncbi:histidine phosphatase family protein [Modicisalibacter xianhensis]|uniref:Broad specificity phosphatase PhoE n=1 Tax=Modicisalibacter xianhensis TaxID=442341 RepID=A0A1I2ZM00_9GAMM|nr:histidine phosphatase family protein [Halomonas xianhensis]SFH38754.1 Broad specificity phosphatase PhoE [Halomonas xianhensis]